MKFLPRAVDFDALFLKQSVKLVETAELLGELFSGSGDLPGMCRRIYAAETEANALFQENARQLASTFITSLDREDIHALNEAHEEVVNLIRSITNRTALYGLDRIRPAARGLVDALCEMVAHTHEMLLLLHARRSVEAQSGDIRRLKDQTDALLLVAMGELFESEIGSFAQVVELVKWTQVFDRIEEALVRTEKLAGIIEGISLKNA